MILYVIFRITLIRHSDNAEVGLYDHVLRIQYIEESAATCTLDCYAISHDLIHHREVYSESSRGVVKIHRDEF